MGGGHAIVRYTVNPGFNADKQSTTWQIGRMAGDVAGAAYGMSNIIRGGLLATSGGIAIGGTGGAAAAVAVPELAIAAGAIQAGYGGAVTYTSFNDFRNAKDAYNFAKGRNTGKRIFNVKKQESRIWNRLNNVKGRDRKTSGSGKNKRYYEWDNRHNDIEVYNAQGRHLGSMDPTTGRIYKGPDKTKRIKV